MDLAIDPGSFRAGSTPLALACKIAVDEKPGNEDVVKALLDREASPLTIDESQQQILLSAVQSGNVHIVRMLLGHGASLADLERLGTPALLAAATKGRTEMYKFFDEELGVDVNQTSEDEDASTTLILAAGYVDSVETITTLVSLCADVNARMLDGRSALPFAARRDPKALEEIRFVHHDEREGLKEDAALKGKIDILRALLDSGADIEPTDNDGWTPLHFAARYHRLNLTLLSFFLGAAQILGRRFRAGYVPNL